MKQQDLHPHTGAFKKRFLDKITKEDANSALDSMAALLEYDFISDLYSNKWH